MSHVSTWKCDGCGKLRVKDTNHWWTLDIVLGKATMYGVNSEPYREAALSISRFSELNGTDSEKHYCGEDCASQAIQRWMATGKLEPASQVQIHKGEMHEEN